MKITKQYLTKDDSDQLSDKKSYCKGRRVIINGSRRFINLYSSFFLCIDRYNEYIEDDGFFIEERENELIEKFKLHKNCDERFRKMLNEPMAKIIRNLTQDDLAYLKVYYAKPCDPETFESIYQKTKKKPYLQNTGMTNHGIENLLERCREKLKETLYSDTDDVNSQD